MTRIAVVSFAGSVWEEGKEAVLLGGDCSMGRSRGVGEGLPSESQSVHGLLDCEAMGCGGPGPGCLLPEKCPGPVQILPRDNAYSQGQKEGPESQEHSGVPASQSAGRQGLARLTLPLPRWSLAVCRDSVNSWVMCAGQKQGSPDGRRDACERDFSGTARGTVEVPLESA